MKKLTEEQYNKLYSKNVTMGEFIKLRQLAQDRMDYVRDFLQENWVGDTDVSLDYDNAQSIALGQHFRELADGFFDPERYVNFVTFQDGYCTEEKFYPHRFSLITIDEYEIDVNTKVLYMDFEQEIIDWVKENGNATQFKKLEEHRLKEAYASDYRKVMELLGPELNRYVRMVDFHEWEFKKERYQSRQTDTD